MEIDLVSNTTTTITRDMFGGIRDGHGSFVVENTDGFQQQTWTGSLRREHPEPSAISLPECFFCRTELAPKTTNGQKLQKYDLETSREN